MTVIAGFNIMGKAALMGDLLASKDGPPKGYLPIPMVDDPERVLWGQLGYSAGLFRKLFLVSPYLCIAWAGGREGAARIADEMSEVAGSGPVPKGGFLNYMGDLRRETQTGAVSLIVLVIYDTGEVELLATPRARRIEGLPEGMHAFCAGSGWDHAGELLLRRGAMHEEGPWDDIALGLAHKLVGILLSREALPGIGRSADNPLSNGRRYGVGYEIASIRDKRITLDADTTFLFWKAHLSAKGRLTLSAPRHVIRNAYPEGRLVLRSAPVQKPWTTTVEVPYKDQLCLTAPKINEPAAAHPESVSTLSPTCYPSLLSIRETSVIRLSAQNGPRLIATVTQPHIEGHTRNVYFSEHAHSTTISLNGLAVEGFREQLERKFNSPRFERVKVDLQAPIR